MTIRQKLQIRNEKILKYLKQGHTFSSAAKQNNLTRERVRQIANKMGFCRKEAVRQRNCNIIESSKKGVPLELLAHEYKVCVATVRMVLRKNEQPKKQTKRKK